MRRLFFIIILSVLVFFALNPSLSFAYEKEVKSLSSSMAENIGKAGKKTIAVVDFVDLQGNVTELGRFIAEEFSIALTIARKGFKVVDRTHLKTILKEHKLVVTGMIDPTTAKKLGQISGVDALVTGTITPFGDSVRLAIKILDTATGDVIDALSGDIAKTKAIEELLARGIESTTPTTRESAGTIPSAPGSGKAVEGYGFAFKPVKCFRRGDALICTVSFINTGDEQVKLQINGTASSYMTDNIGNQYPATPQIGNRKDSYAVMENFLPQTPVNVHFMAKDVNPGAIHMTVVISTGRFEKNAFYVTQQKLVAIKNIPITK